MRNRPAREILRSPVSQKLSQMKDTVAGFPSGHQKTYRLDRHHELSKLVTSSSVPAWRSWDYGAGSVT